MLGPHPMRVPTPPTLAANATHSFSAHENFVNSASSFAHCFCSSAWSTIAFNGSFSASTLCTDTAIITTLPQSHLRRACRYPSLQRMHSSTACASCAMSTADKSSCSSAGTLHPYISPLTHQSLTITFTIALALLTILIQLQQPAGILQV